MAGSLTRLFLQLFLYFASSYCTEDNCRQLEFLPPMKDKALRGHVIHTSDVSDLEMCQFKCYLASSCISLNLGPIRANKKRSCELCDAHGDGNKHSDALTFRKGYLHQGTNNVCAHARCYLNSTCQTGFTEKGYRCLCPAGFTGEWCNIRMYHRDILFYPHSGLVAGIPWC
ncbi:hypothetical protein pdam_00002902 [Pocillopora damicornis]|uniref:EGF-like domain-containing protein n=1 Tax=Pocillopora damicornis TaxID=46731 RepID=A0A3M6U916_POCDA|nr:hypothetical protein pdam_00002902 [Pocillopora damicornis]